MKFIIEKTGDTNDLQYNVFETNSGNPNFLYRGHNLFDALKAFDKYEDECHFEVISITVISYRVLQRYTKFSKAKEEESISEYPKDLRDTV